jgi:dCTP deaminase
MSGSPLVDWEIREAHLKHELRILPWWDQNLRMASYELTLSPNFKVFDTTNVSYIDPTEPQELMKDIDLGEHPDAYLMLHPGEFVLGSSVEVLHLSKTIAGQINGKSSLGRRGLQVHATAGWFDPGFRGTATLELSCVAPVPIRLRPDMIIAQMVFFRTSVCQVPYDQHPGSHYLDQAGPVEGARVSRSNRSNGPMTESALAG